MINRECAQATRSLGCPTLVRRLDLGAPHANLWNWVHSQVQFDSRPLLGVLRGPEDRVQDRVTDGASRRVSDLGASYHTNLHEVGNDADIVVKCTSVDRRGGAEHTSFDLLGYTFRGRLVRGRRGFFVSFAPVMSTTARKAKAVRSGPGTSTAAAVRTRLSTTR
jgi:hypothetical protein